MASNTFKIEVGPVEGTAMLKLITRAGVSTKLVTPGEILELEDNDGIVALLGKCLLKFPDGSIYKMKVPSQVTVTKTPPSPGFFRLLIGEFWLLITDTGEHDIITPAAAIGVEG